MQVQRVQINKEQIRKVAEVIKTLPEQEKGLNFYSFGKEPKVIVASDMYPSLNHPKTVDFFSFACLHQFGFWFGDENGYSKPLVGTIKGKESKGSDLLWKSLKKALDADENVFTPEHLKDVSEVELKEKIFVDDKGTIPFQDMEKRFEISREYGRWFIENKVSPKGIVIEANNKKESLKHFLDEYKKIPGFSQDPLQKKALLLAMALTNRPEGFLTVKDPENWAPIIDYHLMRLALRLGMVELDDSERSINEGRKWTGKEQEELIRKAVFQVAEELIQLSGRPMSLIDETMWLARKYCPEMTEPECPKCIFQLPCKKDTKLFQPVLRTIDY